MTGATESCCRQNLTINVINYRSTVESIVNLADRRRSSLLCSEHTPLRFCQTMLITPFDDRYAKAMPGTWHSIASRGKNRSSSLIRSYSTLHRRHHAARRLPHLILHCTTPLTSKYNAMQYTKRRIIGVLQAVADMYGWRHIVVISDDETESYCWYDQVVLFVLLVRRQAD